MSNHSRERLGIQRFRFESGNRYLVVEILDNNLAHFELSEVDSGPDPMNGIFVTPMVDKDSYPQYQGPTVNGFARSGQVIETSKLRISISDSDLGVTFFDKVRNVGLTKITGQQLDQGEKKLLIDKGEMQNAYGIGNLFHDPSTADGDWVGRSWNARNHGNFRYGFFVNGAGVGYDNFHGGGPSVSQFPMLYALGQKLEANSFQNYGLFLDHVYRLSWDFDGPTWEAKTWGDQLRWFFFAGPNLKTLRRDFMNLVGRPPVPPRDTFGLWVSEFGFDNWTEIQHDLDSLVENGFPVDGIALDIQWFGGSFDSNEHDPVCEPERMGTLVFNEENFPNAETTLAEFREQYGVNFMPIEESYVDFRLQEYTNLNDQHFLARVNEDEATTVTRDFRHEGGVGHCVWWGSGGMIDWTNPDAGDYWHQHKRLPLTKMAITSHWLDLGEPEMYYENSLYYGLPELGKMRHGDVHNIYNLCWTQSIFRGYQKAENQETLMTALDLHKPPRHFALSRSGTVGSQRYGGMWSGDVGRNMGSFRAHLNTQMHMSMAGMDYYTSDAGGFDFAVNCELGYSLDELYTQWFATNCLLDIPLRPHGWANNENLTGNFRFAPDQRGHLPSNLCNLQLRYRLGPYIYSLAHLAWLQGEAIFPPLVYHYPGDMNVRENGNAKMIGKDLLFGVVAGFRQTDRKVYLPEGRWIDYHSLDWYESEGQSSPDVPLIRNRNEQDGIFTNPLFARAGAILPLSYVDTHTRNMFGKRTFEPSTPQEETREHVLNTQLLLRVFVSENESSFVLYEDDGQTLDYVDGNVRTTRILQALQGNLCTVRIEAAQGNYIGAIDDRCQAVELVTDGQPATSVSVNDVQLTQLQTTQEFDSGQVGWLNAGRNRILARSQSASVNVDQEFEFQLADQVPQRSSLNFVCSNGSTSQGEAIFVLGNLPQLGEWDPAKAIRLDATQYPNWCGIVEDLPPNTQVEWKFIRRLESGGPVIDWDSDGSNHVSQTSASGFSGTARANFYN